MNKFKKSLNIFLCLCFYFRNIKKDSEFGVEMAGIEPACRKKTLKLSTDVVYSLFFGPLVMNKQECKDLMLGLFGENSEPGANTYPN